MTALKSSENKSPLVTDPLKKSPVNAPMVAEKPPTPSTEVDIQQVMDIGKDAGQRLQELSMRVIAEQKLDNTDVMQTKLNSLIKEAKSLTPDQSKGFGNIVKKLLGLKEDLFSHFESASDRIETLNKELAKEFAIAESSVKNLDTLKDGIGSLCLSLHRDIELLTNAYTSLQEKFDSLSEDQVKEKSEIRGNLDLLETKIVNAKGQESITLKMGERLNGMKMTSKLMLISGKNAIDTGVPTYIANFSAYIESVKQKKFIEFNNGVINNVNEAIQLGSTIAKENQIEAVRLVNRPTISLETLKIEQQNLLETLEETLKISAQARLDRATYLEDVSKSDSELLSVIKRGVA